MKIEIKAADRAAGFTIGRFRPRAVSLLSGAAVMTAVFAAAGCSALGGTSASAGRPRA